MAIVNNISKIHLAALVLAIIVLVVVVLHSGSWQFTKVTPLSYSNPSSAPVPGRLNLEAPEANVANFYSVSGDILRATLSEEAALQPDMLQTCRGKELTGGYVLALMNAEQQTAGSANLMSLQCWAATMNMVVVEYFMPTSMYMVPDEILNGTASPQQVVRVRNLYNISYWNEYSKKQCYAPLVSWEEFLCNAPREVVLVHIAYQGTMGDSKLCNCPPGQKHQDDFKQKYAPFLRTHGFRITREVCIRTSEHLSTRLFNSIILGGNSTSKVTVIIDYWRGAATMRSKRVSMNDTKCDRLRYQLKDFAKPSSRLLDDTHQYREMVLQNKEYSAVMVRLEHAVRNCLQSQQLTTWSPSQCLKGTISTISDVTQKYNLNTTFWSLDVGKYGTMAYNRLYRGHEPVTEEVLHFMQERYNVSYLEVEASLTGVSGMSHAAYIAALQQNIAARAKCLVLIGGGSFQAHAKALYASLHKGEFCVVERSMEWLKQQCQE